MRKFEYGNLMVVCESESTRTGFRHIAVLFEGDNEIDRTKICYLNRTWESFEFESVLNKLVERNECLKLAMISNKI